MNDAIGQIVQEVIVTVSFLSLSPFDRQNCGEAVIGEPFIQNEQLLPFSSGVVVKAEKCIDSIEAEAVALQGAGNSLDHAQQTLEIEAAGPDGLVIHPRTQQVQQLSFFEFLQVPAK